MNEFPGNNQPPVRQEWEQPTGLSPEGPPIPPPSPFSCPHCGQPMQEPAKYCPRCGKRLAQHQPASVMAIVGGVMLALLALPFALAGGCFLIVGAAAGEAGMGAIGVAGVLLAGLCIWGTVTLLRGKRG